MFLMKCTNQVWAHSFKLQFFSESPCYEYGTVDFTESQMNDGWIKCNQKSMDIGRNICVKELFQKIYTSSLTDLGKTMVEDVQR